MLAPRVASVRVGPVRPDGRAEVDVRLEDGGRSRFVAALPSAARGWTGPGGFHVGDPVLYVASLDEESVAAAVHAMAADMGGYWLRYYNSVRPRKR